MSVPEELQLSINEEPINFKSAIEQNNIELLNKVIESMCGKSIDISISPKQLTPLYEAIRSGCSLDFIIILIRAGADIGYLTLNKRNALYYAFKRKDKEIIKYLLEMLSLQKSPGE